jgi:hypothetical protein
VGTKLKGLDQQLKELPANKKGALRPFVAVFRRRFKLERIYITTRG